MSEKCIHCGEPFVAGDRINTYANGPGAHYACFMRGIVGSVAHQQRRCSCFLPGSTESDPPEMSKRQAAEAALKYWETHQGRQEEV